MALDRISRWLGLTDWTGAPSSNGKAVAVADDAAREAKGVILGPGVIPGTSGVQFYSPDGKVFYQGIGSGSDVDSVNRHTAIAASAYCYVAMRWRMRKISEAPLVVVQEDPTTGNEEWLPKHPLAALLNQPSPDLDMAQLVKRTVAYLDMTGSALWVKDVNRGGLPARLVPFSGDEFRVEPANGRMHGVFRLDVTGQRTFDREKAPEEVVYFQELNPLDWTQGISKVDVALQMLNLGQQAIATTKDILRNALFPSVVIQTAPDWDPPPQEWDQFQQAVRSYAERDKKGAPLTLRGGGTATKLASTMKDLIPGDILSRVESTVAAVFGVPAVVLQYQIGMENAPWSQMGEARRMAYEDTIEPEWNEISTAVTRQLLWAPPSPGAQPLERDTSKLVVFDTSKIRALQVDVDAMSQVAERIGDDASLNERRAMVGLEPVDDPAADEIPALRPPEPPPGAGDFANPFADDAVGLDEEDVEAARFPRLSRKSAPAEVWHAFDRATKAATAEWEDPIAKELDAQGDAITRIAERTFRGAKGREAKAIEEDDVAAFLAALSVFIKTRAIPRLRAITYPLVFQTAKSGVEQATAQIGLTFRLVQQALTDYASRETVFLARVMGETTGKTVADLVQEGLEAGDTVGRLTKRLRESAAFSRDRAKLVARTETTRAWNGAQQSSLADYGERTGVGVTKTWLTAQDDRVRDEHAALEGKTLPIDAEFSNGLLAPGEPNCRCTLTYSLEDA